jgi:type I restriction enzyme S subunit
MMVNIKQLRKKILEQLILNNTSVKQSLGEICKLEKPDIVIGKYVNLDAKYLRTGKITKQFEKGRVVQKNDIVILVDGENSGETFVVPCEGFMGSTFSKLAIDKNQLDINYCRLFILAYQKNLRNSKTGSAIPHLNKQLFQELQIPVPPLEEQHKIVAKIDELFKVLDSLSLSLRRLLGESESC